LLELRYIFGNESDFVDKLEFLKKALTKLSNVLIELTARL